MTFFYNIVFTSLMTLSLSFPELILGYAVNKVNARLNILTLIGYGCLSFFLSLVKQRMFILSFIGILFFITTVQINHWLYFGLPIHANDITKVFTEGHEIFSSGTFSYGRLWIGWIVIAGAFALQIVTYKITKKRYQLKYINYLLVVLLSVFPLLIHLKGPQSLSLTPGSSSLLHSYQSFSTWILYDWRKPTVINYEPYTTKIISQGHPTIIFIMGESTNSRFFSLFGYPHHTTPFLKNLSQSDSDFFSFSKGIACSVCTKTSLPLFYNLVREPLNLNLIEKKTVNLFKLAKDQGYKTVYITGQNPKLSCDIGSEYIDTFLDYQDDVNKRDDYVLVDALKKTPLSDKNFIVIHLRHIHSPYETYHLKNNDFMIDHPEEKSYAKAIFWHDKWIKNLLTVVKNNFPKETITLYTSDHGEAVGENGLFGHTILDPIVSDVPIWGFSKINAPILEWIKNNKVISHYELGIKIAELLGIQVINPQDDGQTYYIHGSNLHSPNFEYIPWEKDKNKALFKDKIGLETLSLS